MIQALIAAVLEATALLFAMAAGAWLKQWKVDGRPTPYHQDSQIWGSMFFATLLAACALWVASR